MTQVLLQPASNSGSRQHYADTVSTPVPFSLLGELLEASMIARLRASTDGANAVAVWGVTTGASGQNQKKWDRIEVGDVALFLRDKHAFAKGIVIGKTHSRDLAIRLWKSRPTGDTWEWVYFLHPVDEIDVSYADLNRAAGYGAGNQFQPFSVLNGTKADAVARLAGSPTTPEGSYFVLTQRQSGSGYADDDEGRRYHFDSDVPSWKILSDAGSGQFVYYRPQTGADAATVSSFFGSGQIASIAGELRSGKRDFTATLQDFRRFRRPVPRSEYVPPGWNVRNAITRIPRSSFEELLRRGNMIELEAARGLESLSNRAMLDFQAAGLQFDEGDIRRFAAAAFTKPFILLSGLSGSGKTKLAQAFARWLGCSGDRFALVPVGPDWTSTESVLGYPNALERDAYVRTEALDLLLHADAAKDQLHVLVLDEMNLSHVERYFADLLSAMESGERIRLHGDKVARDGVPPSIGYPRNVVVIGTVNVDETTYMFSPKVLDRANVIEFGATWERMAPLVAAQRLPNLESLESRGAQFAELLLKGLREPARLDGPDAGRTEAEIGLLFGVLGDFQSEFGFRTASEITRFIAWHQQLGGKAWSFTEAIDSQIVQKVLPRINGSQRAVEPVLRALYDVCTSAGGSVEQRLRRAIEAGSGSAEIGAEPTDAPYPLSARKLWRMLRRVSQNGFVSFAEA